MTCLDFKTVLIASLLVAIAGPPAPRTCDAQTAARPLATIDVNTRWALRTVPIATVSSSIIRLGDVVQPLDPAMPLWDRLQTAPIGMFPVNVQTLTFDRDRLDKAIRRFEATPRVIDWYGPEQIHVSYQPELAFRQTAQRNANAPTPTSTISKTAYQQPLDAVTTMRPPNQRIGQSEAERIVHWTRLAIEREQPRIGQDFQIEIDLQQPALDQLANINGVLTAQPTGPAAEGINQFRVVGRSPEGSPETLIAVQLTKLPTIVVPRATLARGHRISEHDLMLKSIPMEKIDSDAITDPLQAVGLEVRKTLRADQPFSLADIGSPILVHRGDLVEVRVRSGGVTVTTNAKTMNDGAESDLVEIETTRPRKRLLARVVQTGLVEIVTRAPATQFREN